MVKYLNFYIVSVLCLLGLVQCNKQSFNVEGKVYCDSCRVLFPTRISNYLDASEVQINCRSRVNNTVTFLMRTTTKIHGEYVLTVPGDHEDDICEVNAVSSSDPLCNEVVPDISIGKVPIAMNSGIESMNRLVNPIGFRAKEAAKGCTEVLNELGFKPLDEMSEY